MSRSTCTRCGRRISLDGRSLVLELREPERRGQPERDGAAVRHGEPGGGLERVRERVAEVELGAHATVERIAQAERGLEGSAPPHLLREWKLPQRLSREQPGLHHFGGSVPELVLGQRVEERRVHDRLVWPVERADEVLPLGKVDPRLAPDRRVDLADERRRDGLPVDSAQVRRGDEADEVGRRAASDRGDRGAALQSERAPESLGLGDRLRALARGNDVRRVDPVQLRDALVHDHCVSSRLPVWREPDSRRGEDDVVAVGPARVRDGLVQRAPSLVPLAELALVAGERTLASADAEPGSVHVDVEQEDERVELLEERPRLDRAPADGDHGRLACAAGFSHERCLDVTERRLSLALEELPDRSVRALDLLVDVDEPAAEPRGDVSADRRLSRPHEADQDEMAV